MSGKQRMHRPREKTPHAKIWEYIADYLERWDSGLLLRDIPIEDIRAMRAHFLEWAREIAPAKDDFAHWADTDRTLARELRDTAWHLQLEINRDAAWRKRQLSLWPEGLFGLEDIA